MPGRPRVEGRCLEVRREGQHVAQVLGRRDHGQRFARWDGHEIALDEVLTRPEHHRAVLLEGGLEGGGVVVS